VEPGRPGLGGEPFGLWVEGDTFTTGTAHSAGLGIATAERIPFHPQAEGLLPALGDRVPPQSLMPAALPPDSRHRSGPGGWRSRPGVWRLVPSRVRTATVVGRTRAGTTMDPRFIGWRSSQANHAVSVSEAGGIGRTATPVQRKSAVAIMSAHIRLGPTTVTDPERSRKVPVARS